MARILENIKGRFILTINDHPKMREVFEPFKVTPVRLKYSASRKEWIDAKELLITNF